MRDPCMSWIQPAAGLLLALGDFLSLTEGTCTWGSQGRSPTPAAGRFTGRQAGTHTEHGKSLAGKHLKVNFNK